MSHDDSRQRQHTYKPLTDPAHYVRLVKILDTPKCSTTVACELKEVLLGSESSYTSSTETPVFTALSYSWGSASVELPIVLDGAAFTVRKNLWDFLMMKKTQGSNELFWIDALCINQKDIMERNIQVRRMAEIYSLSSKVLVWLGWGSRDLEWLFGNYKELSLRKLSPSRLPTQVKAAIRYLDQNEYWQRLWIVQEFLSRNEKTLCFGNCQAPWTEISDLLGPLVEALRPDETDESIISVFRRFSVNVVVRKEPCTDRIQKLPLSQVANQFKFSECSEPRDAVYALLSLVDNGEDFPIDYESTIFEVYVDLLIFLEWTELYRILRGQRSACTVGNVQVAKAIDSITKKMPLLMPRFWQDGAVFTYSIRSRRNHSRLDHYNQILQQQVKSFDLGWIARGMDLDPDRATVLRNRPDWLIYSRDEVNDVDFKLRDYIWSGYPETCLRAIAERLLKSGDHVIRKTDEFLYLRPIETKATTNSFMQSFCLVGRSVGLQAFEMYSNNGLPGLTFVYRCHPAQSTLTLEISSLGGLWIISGLGKRFGAHSAFMRLMGDYTGNDDWSRYQCWIDTDPTPVENLADERVLATESACTHEDIEVCDEPGARPLTYLKLWTHDMLCEQTESERYTLSAPRITQAGIDAYLHSEAGKRLHKAR